jgi:hypothetical protein
MTGSNLRAGFENLGSIDRAASDAILRRVAELSRLAPQINLAGAPTVATDLDVFVISPDGRAITTEDPDLIEVTAEQVDRELIAEAMLGVQALQPGVPPNPRQRIRVPTTGGPYATSRSDVRGLELVGDPKALRVALGPIRVGGVSRDADARLDTGEMYRAFVAGGTLLCLSVPVVIEIAHPHLIGVVEAQE